MSDPEAPATRRHRRIPVRVPARISTIDAETDPGSGRRYFRSSHELAANLSRGGVFIHTIEPLEPGRRLVVELELPGGFFEAVGRVAWRTRRVGGGAARERGGIGVQFLGGSPDHFEALEAYLRPRRSRRSTLERPRARG